MPLLRDKLVSQGGALFAKRGYLPLLLSPIAALALLESLQFSGAYGVVVENIWDLLCVLLSFSGLLLRALTVGYVPAGTSGRNTHEQRATVLNTTGVYSIVRNPLYLANFVIFLGFVVFLKVWWFPLIVIPVFALYYERIILAEEAFLEQKFGNEFVEWAAKTPAVFPRFRLWRRPALTFSLKTVLRREYPGFYLIVITFTILEFLLDTVSHRESYRTWLNGNLTWVIFFLSGTAVYLSLRSMKRYTRLLRVESR